MAAGPSAKPPDLATRASGSGSSIEIKKRGKVPSKLPSFPCRAPDVSFEPGSSPTAAKFVRGSELVGFLPPRRRRRSRTHLNLGLPETRVKENLGTSSFADRSRCYVRNNRYRLADLAAAHDDLSRSLLHVVCNSEGRFGRAFRATAFWKAASMIRWVFAGLWCVAVVTSSVATAADPPQTSLPDVVLSEIEQETESLRAALETLRTRQPAVRGLADVEFGVEPWSEPYV